MPNALFSNTYTDVCPFVSCDLYDANDCGGDANWSGKDFIAVTPLDDESSINLLIESDPFSYSFDICLRCFNDFVNSDVISFTVSVGQSSCVNSMSNSVSAMDTTLTYLQGGLETLLIYPTASFVDWDTTFQNSDTTTCGITSC